MSVVGRVGRISAAPVLHGGKRNPPTLAEEARRITPTSYETCRLLCVDPAQAAEFWPHVAPLIEQACRRGLHDFAGAEQSVRSGAALLWIVWDQAEIVAALTTELHRINGRKLCFIATLGGKQRERWLHLIEGIESYARTEDCAAVIIMGRSGWQRTLMRLEDGRKRPGAPYRTRGVIMERTF